MFKYQHDPTPVYMMVDNEYLVTQLSSMKAILLQKLEDEPYIKDVFNLDLNGD